MESAEERYKRTRLNLAIYYLNKIKTMAKPDSLSENDIDFIHNILENGRLTLDECKLSDKEYEYLARVMQKAIS